MEFVDLSAPFLDYSTECVKNVRDYTNLSSCFEYAIVDLTLMKAPDVPTGTFLKLHQLLSSGTQNCATEISAQRSHSNMGISRHRSPGYMTLAAKGGTRD